MRGRWLTNLGLLVIVVLLTALTQMEQAHTTRSMRLTGIAPESIDAVRLERAGGSTLALERRDGRWRMTEPLTAPADAQKVHRLLAIAVTRTHRALPAAAADLAQLGLAPPSIRLRLNDLDLLIGATEPIAEQRYVQVGDMLYLIDDRFLPRLLADPEDYLSRRLLPPGFSPELGQLDERPLPAHIMARLATVVAERVEPMGDALSGHLLRIESAGRDEPLRFLIDDAGTRWTRPDQHLSYVLTSAPLADMDQPTDADPPPPATPTGSSQPPDPRED